MFGQLKYGDYVKMPNLQTPKSIVIWRYSMANHAEEQPSDSTIVYSTGMYEYLDTVVWKREQYNEDGFLVYSEGFVIDVDYPVYTCTKYAYDNKNRIVEENDYNSDSIWIGKKRIRYDDGKNTVRIDYENIYGSNDYYELSYNTEGKLVANICYWSDGRVQEYNVFEYSPKANKIKITDTVGSFSGKTYITLNRQGKQVKSLYYNLNNKLSIAKYYTYNKKHLIIREKWLVEEAKEVGGDRQYFYDSRSRLLKTKRLNPEGKSVLNREYFYRHDGFPDYEIQYDFNEKPIEKFVYVYQ